MWYEKYLKEYEDKVVLVTGGAGAIGGQLVRCLASNGTKEVLILDDMSSAYPWNIPKGTNVSFIEGSILDDEILRHVFKRPIDIVFHLAAHFANQNSVENPETDLMVNGLGILKVLEFSHLKEVERFVYSSSGCGVYGLESKMPYEEHDISISLYTPYQVTKLVGELYTYFFHNLYEMPITNARFFNSYGPGEVSGKYRNVIPNFFYWARNKNALPITGTGEETRDFTFVGDIVNGLMAMGIADDAIGESINLGTSVETKIKDLAKMINDLTHNDSGVTYTKPRDWDKKKNLRASIEKARRLLGYEPATNMKSGLKSVDNWFDSNWENIIKSAEF